MSEPKPVTEMTAEERAERLAELKARRRARLRKAAIGTGIGMAALLLVILVAGYWLLQTVAGRDVLMAQVIARLPAGSSLTWSKIEGPLAGPLILHDLDFRYEDLHLHAQQAYLDPDIRPLLGRKLRLDALQLKGVDLELGAPSDEPFELPRWPDVLPALEVPLSFQADTIAVDNLTVTRLGEHQVSVHKLRGGLTLADGELEARALKVNTDLGDLLLEGHYRPHDNYQTDLVARALVPLPTGEVARLGLAVRGDLDRMEAALAGNAPQPVHAMLILTGRDAPVWRAFVSGDRLMLGDWLPGSTLETPLSVQLAARGRDGRAHLRGRVQQGGQEIVLAPSTVVLQDQVLHLEPLVVEGFGGKVSARGTADFSNAEEPRFQLSLSARGLSWTPAADGDAKPVPVFLEQALLGVAGSTRGWAAYGTVRAARDAQQATLRMDVRGSDRGAYIEQLVATTPGGSATVEGKVGWEPVLAWEASARLKDFDPGYFMPGWDGRLSGALDTRGSQAPAPAGSHQAGPITARIDLPQLQGQLRGRRVDGRFKGGLDGDQGHGELRLQVGTSRVEAEGTVGERIDVTARFQPLHLNDLLPGANGTVSGTAHATGLTDSPDIRASLHGSGLRWDGYAADTLSLDGDLPWRGRSGRFTLDATGLEAGVALDRLTLTGTGNLQRLQLSGLARNELASLVLDGDLGQTASGWAGSLQSLQIDPAKGDDWQLQSPARFQIRGSSFSISQACLGAVGGGNLCASADWPSRGASFQGQALPLALVQPWIPLNEGRRTYLRGQLDLDGNVQPRGNGLVGKIRLLSPEGGIRLGNETRMAGLSEQAIAQGRGELLRYDNFNATIDLTPQAIDVYAGIGFKGDGFVDAKLRTGWSATSPLVGDIYLNMSRLTWLELFSPDLVRPTGLLEGHISLRGERDTPLIGGEAKLSKFAGEFPALGLTLSDGSGSLVAQPDGSARIQAQVGTGGAGPVRVDGSLSLFGQEQPLQLAITGQRVLVADIPEIRAVADLDLAFTLDGAAMDLRGQVTVPEADLDLERLERGTSASDDVVVLDPYGAEITGESSPLAMNLRLRLGDKVAMKGFGLKGTLGGELTVTSIPGKEMTANGAVEIGGRYRAYGQDLTITDGRLLWNNNPVSDPRIDINAKREVGAVTAGIRVSGRAMQPRVDVWANPSTSQSEALSYLLLGRSLSLASTEQADQVNAAAAALSAGSGLLAGQIGAKLGLDDAGVSQSRALGGSVLGVGKFITPKLYVGYGVSLIGAGQVLTLKYLLRKGFDIEVESSTVENRGSVNWRTEK